MNIENTENENVSARQPHILYVKRNSLDDGPGIRTVVFMKGCPLSCVWCHNPESKNADRELLYDGDKCIACGKCIDTCLENAISKDNRFFVEREKCTLCFKCTDVCPSKALHIAGSLMSPEELFNQIKRDVPFYNNSGGGVTFTGGEPAMFSEYVGNVLSLCHKSNIHTLVETSGCFNHNSFMRYMHPYINQVYFDLKIFATSKHKEYTGVDNDKIIKNLISLLEAEKNGGAKIFPRVPLIPGITDLEENLIQIADFLRLNGVDKIFLLPYNPTWMNKSSMIGTIPEYNYEKWMSVEEIEKCAKCFEGLEVIK